MTAERATVAQLSQIGVESIPGTAVPADILLASMELTGGIKAENRVFRPTGQKYASFVVPGKEWSEYGVGGWATYGEIVYALAGILCEPVITSDTTLGKKWVFTPELSEEDVITTYSIEQGSAESRAHKAAYGVFTEFGLNFSRGGVEYTGAIMAQAITDAATPTAADHVETPPVPIAGNQISVYAADSWAGLSGASRSSRVLGGSWRISNRHSPLWVLDASKTSYVAHVETVPTVSLELTLEADAAGMAFLTLMRNATQKWIRLDAVGAPIEVGKNYLLQIDGCYNVSEPKPFEDRDGVYAIGWNLVPVYDSTTGVEKTFEVTVRNKLAAL
jgi:hypothetical protein